MTGPCRCGHPADHHRHYRPGTDCSFEACRCPRYRRPGPLTRLRDSAWTVRFLAGLARDLGRPRAH